MPPSPPDAYRTRQIRDAVRRARRRPEESLHRLVVDWLGWNRGKLRCLPLHIPNQSPSAIQRAINAALGAASGAPDLLFLPTAAALSRGGRILHLELKSPDGVQSEAQRAFQSRAEAAGHLYRVARTLEEAAAAVREARLISTAPGPTPGT